MKAFFAAITALFATLPGLSTLVSSFGAPPGRKEMYTAVLTLAGCLTMASIYILRGNFKAWRRGRLVILSTLIAATSLVSFSYYAAVFRSYCAVNGIKESNHGDGKRVYFPLKLYGDFEKKVQESKSRAALVDEFGAAEVAEELERMPNVMSSRAMTDIVLLVWYSAVIMGFTMAFALLGFYEFDLHVPAEKSSTK